MLSSLLRRFFRYGGLLAARSQLGVQLSTLLFQTSNRGERFRDSYKLKFSTNNKRNTQNRFLFTFCVIAFAIQLKQLLQILLFVDFLPQQNNEKTKPNKKKIKPGKFLW